MIGRQSQPHRDLRGAIGQKLDRVEPLNLGGHRPANPVCVAQAFVDDALFHPREATTGGEIPERIC